MSTRTYDAQDQTVLFPMNNNQILFLFPENEKKTEEFI